MIFEYALEPKFVASIKDFKDYRYFKEKFGIGTPRIVSRYPKKWKKYTWECFSSDNDIERKRFEELLTRLSEVMIKRDNIFWDENRCWIKNAIEEHSRKPFHAIITSDNPNDSEFIIIGDNLEEDVVSLWKAPHGTVTERNAKKMASVISSMLSNCEFAVFIDPHFNPIKGRYIRPLKEFFSILNSSCQQSNRKQVVVCTNSELFRSRSIAASCQPLMPRNIPKGLVVKIRTLKKKDDGPRLHNRYIITDIGGVKFQHGLDDDNHNNVETDNVDILTREQYEEVHKNYYQEENSPFEIVEEIEIVGEWKE